MKEIAPHLWALLDFGMAALIASLFGMALGMPEDKVIQMTFGSMAYLALVHIHRMRLQP